MKNKDIIPINKDGQRHGYWEVYWSNGMLWYKGNYINGKREGYWEWYKSDGGNLKHKDYYIEI